MTESSRKRRTKGVVGAVSYGCFSPLGLLLILLLLLLIGVVAWWRNVLPQMQRAKNSMASSASWNEERIPILRSSRQEDDVMFPANATTMDVPIQHIELDMFGNKTFNETNAVSIGSEHSSNASIYTSGQRTEEKSVVAEVRPDTTHATNFSGPNLWIHVQEIVEGMSSWRIAVAEILLVAKKLNLTFIEPCVINGRIRPCMAGPSYRLGDVFDLNVLRNYHPYIVSHEDFLQRMSLEKPQTYPMCFAMPNGFPPVASVCRSTPNVYQNKQNEVLDQALKDGNGIIDIRTYRKYAFKKTMVNSQTLLRPRPLARLIRDYFEFRQEHYETVALLLSKMGIHNMSYNVIHWRAEAQVDTEMNYDSCADKVLHARQIISPRNETPTVLMSSLNLVSSRQWKHTRLQRPELPSLRRLLDAGMHKMDQVLAHVPIPDMVVLAVWDQIMATQAQNFTTCSQQCGKHHACATCAFQGNFAQMALDLRTKHGKSSEICWP